MYIKFILNQLKHIPMLIFSGLYVFPFKVYPNRVDLFNVRDNSDESQPWYYWYADTYERNFGSCLNDYLNSTYGLYEFVKDKDGLPDYAKFAKFSKLRKFILAYRWQVIRNGIWNYIIRTAPKVENRYNIREIKNTGGHSIWLWRNKSLHGVQHVTWEHADGSEYFRYSFTKRIVFRLYINFMLGTGGSNNRNLIKCRLFLYKKSKK